MSLKTLLYFLKVGYIALVGDLTPLIRGRIVNTLNIATRTGFTRDTSRTLSYNQLTGRQQFTTLTTNLCLALFTGAASR